MPVVNQYKRTRASGGKWSGPTRALFKGDPAVGAQPRKNDDGSFERTKGSRKNKPTYKAPGRSGKK